MVDQTTDLVIGVGVLAAAAWAINQGYLGKAIDAVLNLKLPSLPNLGGGSGDENGPTNTGQSGGGSTAPLPTGGTTIWTSSKWANGHARDPSKGPSDAKFGSKDPDDSQFEASHAGTGCSFNIDGKGVCTLGGDRCRIYILGNNYNSEMIVYGAFMSSNADFSLRLRSRHNEGGAPANRFGGYGSAVQIDGTIKHAREDYHNVHTTYGSGKAPKPFKVGQFFGMRFSAQDDGSRVVERTYIDYMDGAGWVKGYESSDTKPASYMLNKADFAKTSYSWFRTNGGGKIAMKNVIIREVGPLSSAGYARAMYAPLLA